MCKSCLLNSLLFLRLLHTLVCLKLCCFTQLKELNRGLMFATLPEVISHHPLSCLHGHCPHCVHYVGNCVGFLENHMSDILGHQQEQGPILLCDLAPTQLAANQPDNETRTWSTKQKLTSKIFSLKVLDFLTQIKGTLSLYLPLPLSLSLFLSLFL